MGIRQRTLKIAGIVVIIAALGIAAYAYLQYQKRYPSTSDAYIQANVVYVAAQVSGPVSEIFVTNHQYVSKSQSLLDINPQPFQIALAKAQAQLANTRQQIQAEQDAVKSAQASLKERQAQLVEAQKQSHRIRALVRKQLSSAAQGDKTEEQLQVAKAALVAAKNQLAAAMSKLGAPGENNAQLRTAKATLAQAKLDLQYTHIKASTSGYLENFSLRVGSMVTAQQQLFAIIDNHQWWASANFKETQLARIHSGQPASITIDMYPDHRFHGYVQSISPGSGASFSLLPPENATGNWVKVTQRFPVKVIITDPSSKYPLRLGASSTVTINTTGKQHPPQNS